MDIKRFDSKPLWSAKHTVNPNGRETLVIHCSDSRFVGAIHEFLHTELALENFDLIAVPGSIHFLVSKIFPKYVWVARHWIKFFFRFHRTSRVIIFSHQDCGWYKFMHATEEFTEKIFRVQQQDVLDVPAILADIGNERRVTIEHYFVGFDTEKITVQKQ